MICLSDRHTIASLLVRNCPMPKATWERGWKQLSFNQVYILWFNSFLCLNFISLCFKRTIIHYQSTKQRKRKFNSRIKLNHNIYVRVFSPVNFIIILIFTYIYIRILLTGVPYTHIRLMRVLFIGVDGCAKKVDVSRKHFHWRRYQSTAARRGQEIRRHW